MFVFDKLKKKKLTDIYFYNNKILSQEYIYSWPLIGGPCPCYRPVTPSLWPRPYSSPVSTTPCWRGSPPPGTKPDSGSYKANIYNLDIYNNFVQMLYVSLWWSALRVCNLCIPPGRDFLSHQGYLNAVSKSTIPVRVIVLWIVTNLQWYTEYTVILRGYLFTQRWSWWSATNRFTCPSLRPRSGSPPSRWVYRYII